MMAASLTGPRVFFRHVRKCFSHLFWLVGWQALDKVQQSLNEALHKLKADEDAENELHKVVADGRDRLGRLHRELGEP